MKLYQTRTTETLNDVTDSLGEFQGTQDIFTTYLTSKATGSIAHVCMKDLKMQLKAEHDIKDEERTQCGEALSCAQ
jgi:hypothetical protein